MLVAEDVDLTRQIAVHMIQLAGHTCDAACNGQEAIDLAETTRYDLIFMDLLMPGVHGLQAAEQIKKGDGCSSTTPIVALSELRPGHNILSTSRRIVSRFMDKPLTLQKLQELLDDPRMFPPGYP